MRRLPISRAASAGRLFGLALALVWGCSAALACGYCVEDRIAAVYDHALVQRTQASRHQLAFFAWDGPVARDDALRQKMLALVAAMPGVDKGSTRVSVEPASLAIAFDPQRNSLPAMESALQKTLRPLKLSVVKLQVPKAS